MTHKFIGAVCATLLAATCSFAQIKLPAASPSATITQSVGLAKVTIDYSRPSVKGRKIFGDLVPYGKVWRTGANKIPNLKVDQDVLINGKKLAAGTYGIATIPDAKMWTIIFTKDAEQWGVYDYKEANDALRVQAKAEKLAKNQEHFTIEFQKFTKTTVEVVIAWERSATRFTIEHNPHEQILAKIKEETAKPDASTDTYYAAAEYYRDNNLDMKQALVWAEKVLEKDKNWWSYYLRASIHSKLGNCTQAVADAKVSLEGATKDKDDAYIKMNNKIIAGCKGK
jgi:hypothetical protein